MMHDEFKNKMMNIIREDACEEMQKLFWEAVNELTEEYRFEFSTMG